jgi:hypothetical protein
MLVSVPCLPSVAKKSPSSDSIINYVSLSVNGVDGIMAAATSLEALNGAQFARFLSVLETRGGGALRTARNVLAHFFDENKGVLEGNRCSIRKALADIEEPPLPPLEIFDMSEELTDEDCIQIVCYVFCGVEFHTYQQGYSVYNIELGEDRAGTLKDPKYVDSKEMTQAFAECGLPQLQNIVHFLEEHMGLVTRRQKLRLRNKLKSLFGSSPEELELSSRSTLQQCVFIL